MQCPKQSSRGCPQHKHPSIWPAKIVDCIRRYQRQRATTDTFESQQMNFEPEQTPWFLCRLANIRTSFFVRGRRQGRQPLNIYIYIDNQNKVSATLVTCWHPSHGFCCGPVAIAGDHAPRGTIWPKVALLSAMREIAGNPPQRQATIVVTLHSEYHLGMAYTTHLW